MAHGQRKYIMTKKPILVGLLTLTTLAAACSIPGGGTDSVARASTQVADLPAPPDGTQLRYQIEEENAYLGNQTWTGHVRDGELKRGNSREWLLPGCLLHCMHSRAYPIDQAAYATLLPLAVGNTATYTRQWAGGSRHWEHRARVTGQRTVNTPVGRLNVFVVETDIRGIKGHDFQGRTVSWWSPELRVTVYERNTGTRESGEWVSEFTLVNYGERPI